MYPRCVALGCVMPHRWCSRLAAAKTPHEQTVLQAQIAAADRHIDRLVYDLYGLTDDEIKIVEEGTAS